MWKHQVVCRENNNEIPSTNSDVNEFGRIYIGLIGCVKGEV